MSKSLHHQPMAAMAAAWAGASVDVTAGGSGDATEVSGAWALREGHLGAAVVISFTATLGADETLTIAGNIQDADDASGTNAADLADTAITATTVATGPSGGGTVTGTAIINVDLGPAKEAFRVQFTPNLSAANTDTAEILAFYVLGPTQDNAPVRTNMTRLN